jgi:hypothetical protein
MIIPKSTYWPVHGLHFWAKKVLKIYYAFHKIFLVHPLRLIDILQHISGLDDGTLTNEFFTQAVEALANGKYNDIALFEGVDDFKLPTPDLSLLRSGTFIKVGKLMAHAAINTNVAFVGIHPIVSNVIFGGSITHEWPFTKTDVPDITIRDLIIIV